VLLLVALVAGGAVLLLTRGDDEDAASGSPEQSARAYIDAARNQDCETILGLVSRASLASLGTGREAQLAACEAQYTMPYEYAPTDVRVVSQDGQRATVTVTADVPGGTESDDFALVSEDGAWKLDLSEAPAAAATPSTVPMNPPPGP
jgi:hypothetical protein